VVYRLLYGIVEAPMLPIRYRPGDILETVSRLTDLGRRADLMLPDAVTETAGSYR
jgi:hypothetical protein